jgi:hypothetical protein
MATHAGDRFVASLNRKLKLNLTRNGCSFKFLSHHPIRYALLFAHLVDEKPRGCAEWSYLQKFPEAIPKAIATLPAGHAKPAVAP